jgi:hypothetical protein
MRPRERDSSTARDWEGDERDSAEDAVEAAAGGGLASHVDGEERLRHLRQAEHS